MPKKISSFTHREILSEYCQIKPKSDCIYIFPIDLEQQTKYRLVPNKLKNGKYNLIYPPKPKSDCIYYFSIDLKSNEIPFAVPKINRKIVNTIWFRLDLTFIYHFPIDLESNETPFAVPNHSENGKFRFNLARFVKKKQRKSSPSAAAIKTFRALINAFPFPVTNTNWLYLQCFIC